MLKTKRSNLINYSGAENCGDLRLNQKKWIFPLCPTRSRQSTCWLLGVSGGKLEADESLFDCIEREILEELQCRILARQHFDKSISHQKYKLIELHAIECELISQEPKVNKIDHDLLCWTTPSNMVNLGFALADIPFVRKLQLNEN